MCMSNRQTYVRADAEPIVLGNVSFTMLLSSITNVLHGSHSNEGRSELLNNHQGTRRTRNPRVVTGYLIDCDKNTPPAIPVS